MGVLSVFASFAIFWVPRDIFSLIIALNEIIGALRSMMIYIRIYLTAGRHKNQIQALQVQQETQAGGVANLFK